jgi:hypothetical protein
MMALAELAEKGADADPVRKMICSSLSGLKTVALLHPRRTDSSKPMLRVGNELDSSL